MWHIKWTLNQVKNTDSQSPTFKSYVKKHKIQEGAAPMAK